MAITAAHKQSGFRSRFPAAAACAATACALGALLGSSVAAAAAGPGGATPIGATPAPATPAAGRGQSTSIAASPHVTTVRIISASCVPSAKCSGNPHQVSTHGTLMLAGKGLIAGMTVAFPRSPGARLGRGSPAAHLHQAPVGLILTVPSNAHSGHIMGSAERLAPLELLRAPLRLPPRAAPAGLESQTAAVRGRRGQRLAVRRSGDVDLVREQIERRQCRLDRRPGPRRRGQHGVRQEL